MNLVGSFLMQKDDNIITYDKMKEIIYYANTFRKTHVRDREGA